MKPFFTEADCDSVGTVHIENGMLITTGRAISLDKANRLLSERGRVVTGHNYEGNASWWTGTDAMLCKHTHQALLINIEPIEQDSAEKLLKDLIVKYEIAHNVPGTGLGYNKFYERAKALLAKEKK